MENREVRLIDANACSSKLNGLGYDFGESGDYDFGGGLLHAAKIVEEQPTIDPESLRPHGEWIWDEENECWVCSNCESSALNNYRGNSTDSNYCPNCGAVMQGVKDE